MSAEGAGGPDDAAGGAGGAAGAGRRESGAGGMRMPRRLSAALERVLDEGPPTLLADVQRAWPDACGAAIATRAEPVSERAGTVTIACENGIWAQELELIGEQLRARLDERIGADRLVALRFTADLARHR